MKMMLVFALGAIAVTGSLAPTVAYSGEVLTDRCSAEVQFVENYDGKPGSGGVLLKRPSGWTPPFRVKTSRDGYIRWWCHSTTGNEFDPGTWRIEDLFVGTKCEIYADGTPEKCSPDGNLKIGSSAWNGWTAERSRCSSLATLQSAASRPKGSVKDAH